MSLTVTATLSSGTDWFGGIALKVLVFTSATQSKGTTASSASSTTADFSFTPAHSGSALVWLVGDTVTDGSLSSITSNVLYSDIDATDGISFGLGYYTGTVTANSAVTLGCTGSDNGFEYLAAEFLAAGTPVLDPSAPALADVTGATLSAVTAAFSPPPGSVLVAVAVANNYSAGAGGSLSVTSSAGLTWTTQVSTAGTTSLLPKLIATALVPQVAAPATTPGPAWRRRYQPWRKAAGQRAQPPAVITCTGSAALAPMAVSGSGSVTSATVPPSPPSALPGPSWRQVFQPWRKAVQQPLQAMPAPVIASGSAALAPMTASGAATVTGTAITVTATQGGTGAQDGLALTCKVLTGAASEQNGTTGESSTLTTPQQAVTPAATGSLIYGAVFNGAAATSFTADAASTFTQDVLLSGSGDTLGTFRSTGTTTSGTPVTVGASAPAETTGLLFWAAAEILAASGQTLAEDASSPAVASTTTATTLSTATFTPPPGSLLVVQVSSDYLGTGTLTMAVSGGGLTWTQLAGETLDLASVWIARVPYAIPPPAPAAAQPGPAWQRMFQPWRRAAAARIQPAPVIVASGSAALSPVAVSGSTTGSPELAPAAAQPGPSWRKRYQPWRRAAQVRLQPPPVITASGSAALAPLAVAGTGTPAFEVSPSAALPGPAWLQVFRPRRNHPQPAVRTALTYYVSPSGSDGNSGTSASAPWQTVAKVNSTVLYPGDTVLFQGGQTFSGTMLQPGQGGTAASPVTFGSYGTGQATLGNSSDSAIYVYEYGGIVVENLIITGPGAATAGAGGYVGVFFNRDLPGYAPPVAVTNCTITGWADGILAGAALAGGGYSGITITGNQVSANRDAGINVYGSGYSHQNVTITGNSAYNQTGDSGNTSTSSGHGIVVGNASGGTVAYNTAYGNGGSCGCTSAGPVGIWAYTSQNITIEYNVSYGNLTASPGNADGDGFDLDDDCVGCVLQYNIAYENAGFGIACYSDDAGWSGNVIRYNLTWGNAVTNPDAAEIAFLGGPFANASVYGNTFVGQTNAELPSVVLLYGASFSSVNLWNNIFYTAASGVALMYTDTAYTGVTFQGNLYYSAAPFSISWGGTGYSSMAAWRTATGQEKLSGGNVGLQANPLLTAPGTAPAVTSPSNLAAAAGLQLQPGSPCTQAGLNLQSLFSVSPGTQDFFGDPLSVPLWIGAFQGSLTTASPPAAAPGPAWRRAFQPWRKAAGLRAQPPQPPVTCTGSAALAAMTVSGSGTAVSSAVGAAAALPGPAWQRVYQPWRKAAATRIQPPGVITATGSAALAPVAVSGQDVVAAAAQPPAIPGPAWRRAYQPWRRAAQLRQMPPPVITVSGAAALAPMAVTAGGGESFEIPPAAAAPGPSWRRRFQPWRRAAQVRVQPPVLITAAGSAALAPMGTAGSVTGSPELAPAAALPGRSWQRAFQPWRRAAGTRVFPLPPPVTSSGSAALAPMAVSGAGGEAVASAPAAALPGPAWKRRYQPWRRAALERAQPPQQAIACTGSAALAPMGVAASGTVSGTVYAITAAQGGTGTQDGLALTCKVLTGAASAQDGATGSSATLTTPQQSITPAGAGSYIYGAVTNENSATSFGANGQTTFTQNVPFSADGDTFGTFRSTGTTTQNAAVTLGASTPAGVPSGELLWAAAEILAAPDADLAEDPSSPAAVNTTTATTLSTASFSPPPGSLIVVAVSSNGTGSGTLTMAVSAAGLSFTQLAGTTYDLASVWVARVPYPAPVPVSAQPGVSWRRRFQPWRKAAYRRNPPPTLPLLTSSGSAALAPMAVAGTVQVQPLPAPAPAALPGPAWRSAFQPWRKAAGARVQPAPVITATGSAALAPMGTAGADVVFQGAPLAAAPGRSWRAVFQPWRRAASERIEPPKAIACTGSAALAPMGVTGARGLLIGKVLWNAPDKISKSGDTMG